MKKTENFGSETDEALMRVLQQTGSESVFRVLVDRYKHSLLNFVYRFTGDLDSAKDIVQETFIRVYTKRDSYRQIARFSTWVYAIAANLSKTEISRQKKQGRVSLDTLDEDGETSVQLAGTEPLPEEFVDSGIQEGIIQSALLRVPELFREAVILRDIQELSYEEIASALGVEVGTVKSRINRGRAVLRQLLAEIYKDTL